MVFVEVSGVGVNFFECVCRCLADIGTGNFGLIVCPGEYDVAYVVGGIFGKAVKATHTQAGGVNAGVQLIAIQLFGWALSAALYDIYR